MHTCCCSWVGKQELLEVPVFPLKWFGLLRLLHSAVAEHGWARSRTPARSKALAWF